MSKYSTVEEALSMFCPWGVGEENLYFCKGPYCMAWRWRTSFEIPLSIFRPSGCFMGRFSWKRKSSDKDERDWGDLLKTSPPVGFCGLAGKPFE